MDRQGCARGSRPHSRRLQRHQGFAGDIWQVTWDRFSVGVEEKLADFGLGQLSSGHDNRAVTTLANIIIHTARRGHPLTVWAHSQGGAITSLAFYRARRRTSPMRRPAP
jgi:hypothetical protein